MILNSPTISGSLTVTGNIITSGSITISGSIASASYASNAELLDGLDSTVFTLTSSLNAQTASFTAFTASLNAFSASINTATSSFSGRVGALESYTASLNLKTASFATTGSNTFIGTQTITGSVLQSGSFTSTGTLTAQTLVVQTITSSVVYSSGSNIFGNAIGNTQTFTGSVLVTGSLTIAGASSATSYSGTTIYGSTAVCSAVGKFTSCIDAGSGTFSGILTVNAGANATSVNICSNGDFISNWIGNCTSQFFSIRNNTSVGVYLNTQNSSPLILGVSTGTSGGSIVNHLSIASGGAASFACQVCAPVAIFSGCVGMGSTSPQHKLDIQNGNLGIYNNTNVGGGNGGAQLYLGDMNFAGGVYACSAPGIGAVCSPSAAGVAGDLAFFTYTGIAACRTERMRIAGGNVGIGITNPSYALDISGGSSNVYIRAFTSGSSNWSTLLLQNGLGTWHITNDNAGTFNIGTTGDPSTNQKLSITSGGNTCIFCQLSVGPVVIIGNQGGTDTTVLTGGSGQGSALRMNYAGGSMQNLLAGNGDNYFNCLLGKLNAAGGVKFGSGATTLNYYEQGTWTPRLKNGSFTTNAGTSNVGWYTRIGNLITVGGTLDWGAGSGAQDGNSLQITCLPFASSNVSNERNVGQPGAPAAGSIGFKCTGKGQLVLVNDPGNVYIYLIETFQDGSYTTYIHNPLVANAGTLYGFQLTYHI